MNIQLITELPAWWIIICFFAGLLYAYLLYRRDTTFDGIHVWLKRVLFALRTLAVFILAILLLSPLIKTYSREKEKPVIVIAQDNSESIVLNKDSAFFRSKDGYPLALQKFIGSLSDKFDVRTISWGDRIKDELDFNFSDKQTDFSALQKQLGVRFGNRNVGAVVIASDGLYNRGSSPLYGDELKVPIYTIALGDTTIQKDLLISRLNYNKVVYAGNSFPIEITINARQSSGAKSKVSLLEDSATVFTRDINISGNSYSQLIPVILDARKTGLVHYKIKLEPIPGEMTTANNERDIYIQVIDSKQKILIVANAPHPDIAALKNGIESSQNYTVKVVVDPQQEKAMDYNLVIFHNLPSLTNDAANIITQVKTSNTPSLFIVGSQTSIGSFNRLQAGISIEGGSQKSNRIQALVNNNFSRFNVSEEMKRMVPIFPPLVSPFGRYINTTDNAVLLYQKIGAVNTDQPLQIFNENNGFRTGVLCGEGIWNWRLNDYAENGNFNVFNEWLQKTVQNLSVKENRSHFRLINKNNFAENEPVSFDAEVFNDNYELITNPDVTINIINSAKKSFAYTFSKTEKGYTLNAGFLPSGEYSYKATVKVGDKIYNSAGELSVTALQAEQSETVADHKIMYTIAKQSGGEMYYANQLDNLAQKLLARADIKTISYSHYKLRDLIEWKLIFFLLLLLLSIEWFLRKRAGSY